MRLKIHHFRISKLWHWLKPKAETYAYEGTKYEHPSLYTSYCDGKIKYVDWRKWRKESWSCGSNINIDMYDAYIVSEQKLEFHAKEIFIFLKMGRK